ncbi:MAG: arginine repressor [Oscillospiraceae bacterium]|nr:arginine repressor [Oscillospiraceae bacterium]
MPNARHEMILKLISEREVCTQDDLRILLEKQGFQVTQATISRDIRQLGLRKKRTAGGQNCYSKPTAATSAPPNLLNNVVVKLDHAMNTVVINCHAGSAQAACVVLDRLQLPQIVGTIAGDDTIFVLTRSEESAANLVKMLESHIWG